MIKEIKTWQNRFAEARATLKAQGGDITPEKSASFRCQALMEENEDLRNSMHEVYDLGIDWISCAERMPPTPETPYQEYLVWASPDCANIRRGSTFLIQFCKETNYWLQGARDMFGNPVFVTHWCEAVQVLGMPHATKEKGDGS